MPATRSTRKARRAVAKRNVMGVLHENAPVVDSDATVPCLPQSKLDNKANEIILEETDKESMVDFDGTNPDTIRLLCEDMAEECQKRIEAIKVMAAESIAEQQQTLFLQSIKIDKATRQMKIKDFNKIFSCDLISKIKEQLESYHDIAAPVASGNFNSTSVGDGSSSGHKRIRTEPPCSFGIDSAASSFQKMDLETPAQKNGLPLRTPATSLRSMRKGETALSVNGSPLAVGGEAGTVNIRTSKPSRRGFARTMAPDLEFNIDEGKTVDLTEKEAVGKLDAEKLVSSFRMLGEIEEAVKLAKSHYPDHLRRS